MKADCQSFAAVVIIIIAAVVVVVYSSPCGGDDNNRHHCRCKGGRVKGYSPTLLRERGKGRVYSLSTAIVGGMMPTIVATAARGIVERGIF